MAVVGERNTVEVFIFEFRGSLLVLPGACPDKLHSSISGTERLCIVSKDDNWSLRMGTCWVLCPANIAC
jgi:hypothetical protein